MKIVSSSFFIYLSLSFLSVLIFFISAGRFGTSRIDNNCPKRQKEEPGKIVVPIMDCSNSTYYSPIFWYPMKFRTGKYTSSPYSVPDWPGFDDGEFIQILLMCVIYWLLLSQLILLPVYILLKSKDKK